YYRKAWHQLSKRLREDRAKNTCECHGLCGGHEGACGAVHGKPNPRTGGRTLLTCAHLDQDPRDHDPRRLLVMCQSCHLRYDRSPAQTELRNRVALEIAGQINWLDGFDAQTARRHSKNLGKNWLRATSDSSVHAALGRAHPLLYHDMLLRKPMTVHRCAQLMQGVQGWSRTTIRRHLRASGIRPVGEKPGGWKLYDPFDI